MAAIRLLITHRRLLCVTTLTDIRSRYAGTTLGFLWIILFPALLLALYMVVFTKVAGIRVMGQGSLDMAMAHIFAGLIPCFGLVEALGLGVGSLVANKALIKNVVFPVELVPVKAVLVGSVSLGVSLVLLHGVVWVRGIVHPSQLITPVVLVLQILFTIGLIWTLSVLNVFLRDLSHMVSLSMLCIMLASPIAYSIDMVPPELRVLVYVNPVFYLVTLYQGCVVAGSVPLGHLLVFAGLAVSVFATGHWVFARFKELLPDYV